MKQKEQANATPTRLSLILPAYNEAGTIGRTIAEAQSYFRAKEMIYEIIVAADGSDGTRELAAELARQDGAIRVMGEEARGGKGRAIRNAVPLSRGQLVGFVDADGKTPIAELDKILPLFEQGFDLVIGSRALSDSVIEKYQPWYRRWGSRAFGIAMHSIVGLNHIPDTQCGFKFFRRAVATDLIRRQKVNGYMFDVEILFLADRLGYKLAQVGIRWRDDQDSRLQIVRGNLRNGIDLLAIRLRSLTRNRTEDLRGTPVAIEGKDL